MTRWPDRPIIPDAWIGNSVHHPAVVAALSEGYCPKHLTALGTSDSDYCSSCRICWELESCAGTIPTTGPYPPWAVTDGNTVLVCKTI
jgi:hypothetical protein